VKSAGTEYDAASLAAIAAVGTDQSFTAQITKTHGATNLVFEDTMTNMSYNKDVAITVSAGTAPTATQAVVAETATGFKVTFDNTYIAGLADGTVITLKYSGKITSDALSANPATNKATLTSGDGNTSTSEEVKVYNAKFTVTKQDGEEKPLAGAGFVIANSEGKYYKLADDKLSISWVDSIDDATEYKSDATGAVPAFTGLADGTYTLIEKTVPAGYNKAADSTFTVAGNDYTATNLEQTSTVTNESGTVLPSTGGIGTTIFYIIGAILVIGAGVVLVTRRRMNVQ
jgi:fimbrial isopeptide formation D2 family protein/LPXTG-motif cell wall-anchored protein